MCASTRFSIALPLRNIQAIASRIINLEILEKASLTTNSNMQIPSSQSF
jgi:hypothetical protein